jgi:dipeptidyl-peptidase-3
LIELQVRKSTADATGSRDFYNNLTKPIQGWEGEIRDIVLRKKLVRHLISHPFIVFGRNDPYLIIDHPVPIFFLASQNIRPAEYDCSG